MNNHPRYQVFISSTYTDLKEERKKVIKTVMEMDCIPSGMELFPAADEDQLEFIKKVIDDSDYYLIIIGGKYGSLSSDGLSFTEKEYDYAKEIGIKIIALLHDDPTKLSQERTESDHNIKIKLESFVNKVKSGRLVKFWKDQNELSGLVATSLSLAQKMYPTTGWIRGNSITKAHANLLSEINELKKKHELTTKQLGNYITSFEDFERAKSSIIASLNSQFDQCVKDGEKLKIRIMGLCLHKSFEVLSDFLNSHCSTGVRIEVRLSILASSSPNWNNLNERWKSLYEVFEIDKEILLKRIKKVGNSNVSLKLYKYTHMPNWHGWLINHSELFLSSCMWDSKNTLTAGQNLYQHYSAGKGDQHDHMIKLFRRWFDYGRYNDKNRDDSLLFDSSSI